MKLKSVLAVSSLCVALSAPALAGDISLKMTNVKDDQGQLVIRLFNKMQAGSFPDGVAMREEKVAAAKGEVLHVIKDLPNHTYAIGVYQDVNNNGKLEMNFIGAPTEPVANTGKKVMLKPKFNDSSFDVADGVVEVVAEF
jgi:uncharacterized protein (DUF2141 family)